MPDAFVARQPIFNHKLDVVGYELLFRGEGYANDVAMIANPESATATVVLNALTELDLDRIVGTRDRLGQRLTRVRRRRARPRDPVQPRRPRDPRDRAVRRRDARRAARASSSEGYKLALDDFRYREGSEPLLELFDVVKLNINELGREAADASSSSG